MADPLERWVYFLRHAENTDLETLRRLFPEAEFLEAIGVLEMIRREPDENDLYEARLKYQRDERARLRFAVEEAVAEAVAKTTAAVTAEVTAQAAAQAEAALAQARKDALDRGELVGRVRTLQQLLKLPLAASDELAGRSNHELEAMASELAKQLQR